MNVFDLLPNEDLYKICESSDIETLKKFRQTSKRIKAVCEPVLRRKIEEKIEIETEQLAMQVANEIITIDPSKREKLGEIHQLVKRGIYRGQVYSVDIADLLAPDNISDDKWWSDYLDPVEEILDKYEINYLD